MNFVKLLSVVCIAIAMLILAGCSDSGSKITIVRGVVRDSISTAALTGVTITAGSLTTTTDINGQYSLNVAPGSNIKIKADKTGYVAVIDVCGVSEGGTAIVDIDLKATGYVKNLTAMQTTLTTATDPRGTEIKLPAGSIVDSNNNPVDTATIEVTTTIASDANYVENFPGLFIGTQTGQPEKPIESFGFINVEISNGGSDCNIGAGKSADIAIPVGTGAADPGTNTIELWSLNEDTGKWKYEGLATRDATSNPVVYRATVNHFSAYNLDRPIQNAMPLTITVKNGDAVVPGASIVAKTSSGPMWEGRGVTGADGKYRYDSVPAGTNNVMATFGSLKGVVYAYDIVGGEGFATISLQQYTSKTVAFYYMDGATKVKAAGANVNIFSEGTGAGQGQSNFNGKTDADGKVTALLLSTAGFFNLNADLAVGPINYSATKTYNKFADIPAEIELIKP